jgi:3-oxoacyl-[acyl-carrier protein] reductase
MRIIRGRKAVVVGAASGIGRAIALALAAEGADLFLIDRDADGLASVEQDAARNGVRVAVAICDLADPSAITRVTGRIASMWQSVNILVNCAGIAPYGAFHLSSEKAWRSTLAVNLAAPIQVVHELLRVMLRAEEAHIVNVCSVFGLVPFKKLYAYQASKFGLVGFTLALRNDYYRDNFGVTALCPGFVRTPLLENATELEAHKAPPTVPAFFSTTPEAVAAKAVAAIRHDRGLVVVTGTAKLLWWLMRLSPALFGWVSREGWRRRKRFNLPDLPRPEA